MGWGGGGGMEVEWREKGVEWWEKGVEWREKEEGEGGEGRSGEGGSGKGRRGGGEGEEGKGRELGRKVGREGGLVITELLLHGSRGVRALHSQSLHQPPHHKEWEE